MRKFVLSFCLLLTVVSLAAAPIKGFRIEAGQSVIVYVDGVQVCTATTSCFVANLPVGYYKVEVYAVDPGRRGADGNRRGNLLFSERIHFSGRNIHDITISGRNDHRPDHRPDDDSMDYYPSDSYHVMSPSVFAQFLRSLKDTPFDSERTKLIDTVMVTSFFTTDQCRAITDLYTFDSERLKFMKLIYPKIVDKANFFTVIETLTFSSSKDDMNKFVRKWHGK